MRARTFAAVVAALSIITAVAEAQNAVVMTGRSDGGGMPKGAMASRAPLTPDSLSAIVTLDDTQRQRYTTLLERFNQETKPQRDSLATVAGLAREAGQAGSQSAKEGHMKTRMDLQRGLGEKRKAFEDSLKGLLTDDQWKKYDQWRSSMRAGRRGDKEGRPAGSN